jgi:hypothetical protein
LPDAGGPGFNALNVGNRDENQALPGQTRHSWRWRSSIESGHSPQACRRRCAA